MTRCGLHVGHEVSKRLGKKFVNLKKSIKQVKKRGRQVKKLKKYSASSWSKVHVTRESGSKGGMLVKASTVALLVGVLVSVFAMPAGARVLATTFDPGHGPLGSWARALLVKPRGLAYKVTSKSDAPIVAWVELECANGDGVRSGAQVRVEGTSPVKGGMPLPVRKPLACFYTVIASPKDFSVSSVTLTGKAVRVLRSTGRGPGVSLGRRM